MDIEQFREHCLAVKGVKESMPFLHHNVVAFKVMDKMFCMMPLEPKSGILAADLKCDPERSVELRDLYIGVTPGHVPSALMWNRVILDSDVPDTLIVELIAHAVDETIKKLPKTRQKEYAGMNDEEL